MIKRKATFNLIDALIIIILVAIGAGVYFFFFTGSAISENGENESAKIRYVLEVNELPAEFSDNIKVGETVFDFGTDSAAGKVIAVDYKNSVYVGHDKTTGEQKLTTLDDYVNLYITIEGDATVKDRIYFVNDTSMYIGKVLDVMMPNLFCTGSCISLTTVE